ncbi:MAG TPA: ABC transporter, partial [Cyclobacteriaceae bacterium]
MKELKYLNKYLLKYKWHLILGTVFTIISNVFHIIPGPLVRHSIDLVVDNINLYGSFGSLALQEDFFSAFAFSILIYAVLILLMALLRGIFLY